MQKISPGRISNVVGLSKKFYELNFRWKRGTQMLTLPCVLKILQGVYDTGGDWKWVLER